MPKITQYDAPEGLGLRPTETGISAVAGAARRLEADYSQAAAAQEGTGQRYGSAISAAGAVAVKYIDHQQIAAGLAHGAELFDTLGKSKDEAIKKIDLNDPAYGAKVEIAINEWREKTLAPALDNFQKGFMTEKSQEWAQHFVGQTRNHMFVESSADVSHAAGIGIHNAINTFTNESSNTALRTPAAVPTLLEASEHAVSGLVSTSPISGVAGAKVQTEVLERSREQIVKAGAIGAIQKSADPEATAQEWIAKYPKYINGHEAIVLANNARQQIRARNADAEHQQRREKQEKVEISSEATDQYVIEAASKSPRLANDPLAQKVLNDPSLTKNDRKNLLNYIDAKLKPEATNDISAANTTKFLGELPPDARKDLDEKDFLGRVWTARTNPAKPEDAINDRDFMMLRKEIADRKTPEGLALSQDRAEFNKVYARLIDGDYNFKQGQHSVLGSVRMKQFLDGARQQEEAARKDSKNPNLVYDSREGNPYFWGTPQNIARYRVTMKQAQEYDKNLAAGKVGETRPQGEPQMSPTPAFAPPRDAGWSFNEGLRQWRGPDGQLYDARGKKVK